MISTKTIIMQTGTTCQLYGDITELSLDSVIQESLIAAADGKSYRTKFYNLDMIISVGYRIKSHVATR